MPKRALVFLALLAMGGAAFLWWRATREEPPLLLSGSVEARDVEVGSLTGGRVAVVHVHEGERVAAGQPLVTFETTLIEPRIAEARARVAQARAALARVERGPRHEELARARAESQNAEAERRRLAELLDRGVVPRQQYDAVATRAVTAAETLRELERGSRPEDVAASRAALAQAEQELALTERQREEAVVKSPADAVVESLDLRPGDLVAAGAPIARLLEPGQLWVRVYVPEPKLGLVRLGQRARLTVDSFPDRPFPGSVVEIRDRAEYTPRNIQTVDQRMDQVFGVRIAIDEAPELKPGMAALVTLEPFPVPPAGASR
ncbi:MAG TPA: HlyD family efflux transporter periplasmic adaptor subunit [Thermoanaerobaculia bacterium]